jgi:hypothetical protein
VVVALLLLFPLEQAAASNAPTINTGRYLTNFMRDSPLNSNPSRGEHC